MEQQAAAEVCVDLEYCVILNNNNNANVNEDAVGRLDTAAAVGENQGKSCVVVMRSRADDDDHPLKAKDVENNMNTTSSSSSSVMVLIDEGADHAGFIIRGGGGGGEEKRKKAAKKPPKHRGGVDATDQKKLIIKELAELAMIKRARIERMKALIIQKNSSSSSSGGGGNQLFAMLFTILVFLVLLFQGGMSCQISCGTFRGSPPTTTEANESSSFIFIQEELNPSAAHDSV